MFKRIFLVAFIFNFINAVYQYEYEEVTRRRTMMTELEIEPSLPTERSYETHLTVKNLNCEDFTRYALNCTIEAALIYNSTRKIPPMPARVNEWCRSIKHLINCAIDWNSDCRDYTESHYNEESIRGHMHVVNNMCDDERFLQKYDDIASCIQSTANAWESCYLGFKIIVDELKNTSREWTHYETHFQLCCARVRFRRCTLELFFDMPTKCSYDQAVTLQKFSVIVSEGDVFQDCEHNMMYTNCPGGDPRPPERILHKLMSATAYSARANLLKPSLWNIFILLVIVLCI